MNADVTDFLAGVGVIEWTGEYAAQLMRTFFPLQADGFSLA